MNRRLLTLAQVMWPAFLVAGILEMVVFSLVDPSMVHFGDWHPDSTAAYSLMFMVFWLAISLSAFISHWLMSGTTQQERQLPHMGV